MKHTFAIIDKLIILLKVKSDGLLTLDTEEDKVRARKRLDEIVKYTHTLRKLIGSHKQEEYLNRLHDSHIAEIEGWANKVSELFKKLDSLLDILEKDVVVLRDVIENEPEQWASKIGHMALGMVMNGLHDEEEEMLRFRRIAIFQMHELKEIIESEEHVTELLE
ncbi:hypothetical protein KY339_03570 [Candidatus Woesearchaeota archaeon]|nr:hypothetical protein [Candidatus Woesearchaeota archaeon]